VLVDGGYEELPEGGPLPDLSGRQPVLACGSNQSPEVLARKLAGFIDGPVPVVRAGVTGFDSVYSVHFSRNGSIPATFQPAPGATASLFVNWLTPVQQRRLHKSEAIGRNYDFGRLDGIQVRMDGGGVLTHAFAYVSRHGCLINDDAPVALAVVPATGRRWPALTEEQVLALARDRLAPDRSLDDFIREAISEETTRLARTETLKSEGCPFSYGGFTPIAV
jgi:hypothetical protein